MQQMMDALVKTAAGPGLRLTQVPVPTPGIGEVLIKIRKTAICGTDVHIYNWDPWSQQHIHPPNRHLRHGRTHLQLGSLEPAAYPSAHGDRP